MAVSVPRALYFGPFAVMADRFAVAPLLIPMAVSFHVSLAAVSGVASLYYLAYGLMPPVYGVLADRFGRVRVIIGSLARWRYPGSDAIDDAPRGSQIG